MPAWVSNFTWLLDSDPAMTQDEHLYLLLWLARVVNSWLDRVTVRGDQGAARAVQWALARFDAMAIFDHDEWPKPEMTTAVRRLRGLTT
jgi:hypothetical protein